MLQQSGFSHTRVTPHVPVPVVPTLAEGGGGPTIETLALKKDFGPEPNAVASMLIAQSERRRARTETGKGENENEACAVLCCAHIWH